MKRYSLTTTLLFLALLLTGCDNAEQEYSMEYPVSFTFNTSLHPASLLTRLRENSNAFVIVEATNRQGAWQLDMTSNNGKETERILLTTDRENNSVRSMGADNSLIIGCLFGATANDSPYLYVAYDRQCRYCLENGSTRHAPLSFSSNGLSVTCAKCNRTYALVTGTSNDGQRLYTYHARYETAGGLLSVTNR